MIRFSRFCAGIVSLVVLTSAFFVSCASGGVEAEVKTPAVFVTNLKKVNILTADNIIKPMDEIQLFEGSFGDRSFSLPLYIQADEKGISISMLNDFGTSLGDLTYSNNVVEFSSSLFPENLKAEYIVWDIQLAIYKAEALSQRLARQKLVFTVESDGETEVRRILDGSKIIEEITLRKNYMEIKNILRGYEYHLIGVGDE